ncbi:hypothetical protein LDY98_28370, partial [Pseudomonas aeruginosa]|nr:hypothetical protein [Pseudomonas aeruginosa]
MIRVRPVGRLALFLALGGTSPCHAATECRRARSRQQADHHRQAIDHPRLEGEALRLAGLAARHFRDVLAR